MSVAVDRHRDRIPVAPLDRVSHPKRREHAAVDADQTVAGLQAGVVGGASGDDRGDVVRQHRPVGAAVDRDAPQDDEAGEDVRGRPGGDDHEPPRARAAPVRPRVEVLLEPVHRARDPAPLGVGQRRVGPVDGGPEPGQPREGVVVPALREVPADVIERDADRGRLVLAQALGPVEQVVDLVQVARLGPEHPRDLHEAAERDRTDAVLRVAEAALEDGGREPEVEAKRAHPRGFRRGEMAELVHGDEQEQAADGDGDAHAAATPAPAAAERALRSASSTCSSDSTGSGGTWASASSTTPAMSRKPMRPSRNAAHRHLVRGVQHARRGASGHTGLAGEG